MNTFTQFLVNNWQFISTGILFVSSLIIMIIKKRPIKEILDNSCYKDLLILIKDAEIKFGAGHGAEKLDYVLTAFCNVKGLDKDTWLYSSIKAKVESILSTPQKKGD